MAPPKKSTSKPMPKGAVNKAVPSPSDPPSEKGLTGEVIVSDSRLTQMRRMPFVAWNPDALAGRKGGIKVYDEMRTDEQVKACLSLKKAAIVGPGWTLEAPDPEDSAQREVADQLTLDITAMGGTFSDDMAAILSALDYGFSIVEKVFDDGGNRFFLHELKHRAPHNIDFQMDPYGNISSITQTNTLRTVVTVKPQKIVHFVNQPEFDNPYGRSDLRECYRSYFHKLNWIQFWSVWGEKLADAPIVVKHPGKTSAGDLQTVLNAADRMQSKTSIGIPEGWELELLVDGRDPKAVFQSAVDRHDLAIARGLLIPELLGFSGGETKGGSYALSKTHMGAFFFVLDLLARRLEACIQEQIIDYMAAFLAPNVQAPRFTIKPLSEENVEAIAALWGTLVTQNAVITDVKDENHLRTLLGFASVEETDDQLREAVIQKKEEDKQIQQEATMAKAQGPPAPGKGKPGTKDKSGKKSFVVYRGLAKPGAKFRKGERVTLPAGRSVWTENRNDAKAYAANGGVVVRATVPAERVELAEFGTIVNARTAFRATVV